MRNFLNPKWLLIINTAPLSILFLIFIGEYQIINSLLNDQVKSLWMQFGFTLLILALLNFAYIILMIHKNKMVSYLYGVIAILSYIPYLYIYSMHSNKLIPFTIPQWMISDNILLYVGTFLMPTLIYSLFILAIHLTPKEKNQSARKNFSIAITIPVFWYIFIQIILPFWKPIGSNFTEHAIIIFIIATTLAFLFFLIRGILILGLKKSNIFNKHQLLWKIPISIIFPLLGLALNNGHLNSSITFGSDGIFGDFSHYWFYILTVVNGIFICLPSSDHKNYRLALIFARSITFTYTLYFFLVFLPFLPLSVIAIIAVGSGFLMLTPLALFIIHINEIVNDYRYLKPKISPKVTSMTVLIGTAIIPLLITMTYLNDRFILNKSLSYLYTPNYSQHYMIDSSSLAKTLKTIKEQKGNNRNSLFGNQTPYLSSFYNWVVLDNLTLSNRKIDTIEKIFFAKSKIKQQIENTQTKDVNISNIHTRSRFDDEKNHWISWIDLELTDKGKNIGFSEYTTTIKLPTGTWISDYYLYVGNKKEMGILAEKKSAMFVYSQIRNENKDPGILYYLTGNKVAFKVFPFLNKEIRKTGIEFIHNSPITLNIDNHTIQLGNTTQKHTLDINNDKNANVLFISSKEKSRLTKTYRKPFYHFMVDTSDGKREHKDNFINRIKELINKKLINKNNAKISFINTYVSTFTMDENWEKKYTEQKFKGGFYLDRAIKKALFDSYMRKNNSYPVIVVVTDAIEKAIIKNNFSDFKITYPEQDLFYNLNLNVELIPHSLKNDSIHPLTPPPQIKFRNSVRAYPNESNPIAYLPDTPTASLILINDIFDVHDDDILKKDWNSALLLQGKRLSHMLHPELSNIEWLGLVKQSFLSKILTPVTSYIVVENEAQKEFLKRKQQQVLASNKSLDLDNNVERMTEPNLLLLVILLGIALCLKNRQKFSFNKSFCRPVNLLKHKL